MLVGRRAAFLVAGFTLLVAGGGAFVASSRMTSPVPRVLGANRPVNASATEPLDVTAHNSPVLRRNPTAPLNVVAASRIDSPRFSCGLRTSLDGGVTWAEAPIPENDGASIACFAPDLAFGVDGTLYFSFTTIGEVVGRGTMPDAIWLATSVDGGRTLSSPTRAGGPASFQVRLAADPGVAGRLYLSWVQGENTSRWGFSGVGAPIMVSRSDDGGGTWQPPVRVSATTRERVVAPSIAVGDDRTVHVAYLDVGGDVLDYAGAHEGGGGEPYGGPWSLVSAHSSDGGTTWGETMVDAGVVPTQRFLILFPPAPSLAVHRGTVYVAFPDGRLGDPDVWMWKSIDHGTHWQSPNRVNDTPIHDGTSQYLPELTVGKGGRIDVVYYDRRTDPKDRMNEVSLQSSFDGGKTFTPRVHVSDRPFDSAVGVGSERGMPDLGNRLGIVSTQDRALVVWTDTRAGTPSDGKQDLASAVVSIAGPARRHGTVRLVAAAAGISGATMLVSTAWLRRRSPRNISQSG